jgi:hypothetical protein
VPRNDPFKKVLDDLKQSFKNSSKKLRCRGYYLAYKKALEAGDRNLAAQIEILSNAETCGSMFGE